MNTVEFFAAQTPRRAMHYSTYGQARQEAKP